MINKIAERILPLIPSLVLCEAIIKIRTNSYMYFYNRIVDITSESYSQLISMIAIDRSNNLHIVWEGETSPFLYQIRYAKSSDGGNTWSSPVNITNERYSQRNPIIAIDSSNNLHIVWNGVSSSSPNYSQIRYAKSTDGGNTWSSPVNIINENYSHSSGVLAIDSFNNLHIVWYGRSSASPHFNQIRYAKSTDGGNTWSSPVDITSGYYHQYYPKIAIDSSNNLHIVWEGKSSSSPNYYQIRYAKSTDGGNTWSSPVNITSEEYNPTNTVLAIDRSNNLHIVWYGTSSSSPNYNQIRYAKSTDGGNTWSSPVNITSGYYHQYYPKIAIDRSNNLHIVWKGKSSSSPNYDQIRYAKSSDGGNTWSSPVNFTSENYDQYNHLIAIDSSNNLHIVWDGRSSSHYYSQIRYVKSSDGGTNWSKPIFITSEYFNQNYPSVTIDSYNNLHIGFMGSTSKYPHHSQIRYVKI